MESNRIAKLIKAVQNGKPWYGTPIDKVLEGITADEAFQKPIPNCHSIWELVKHIVSWRTFAIEKLQNNEAFEIDLNTEADWTSVNENYEDNWKTVLHQLQETAKLLSDLIEGLSEEDLMTTIPGRKYNMYALLHGIVNHDVYHLGQIVFLKKVGRDVIV